MQFNLIHPVSNPLIINLPFHSYSSSVMRYFTSQSSQPVLWFELKAHYNLCEKLDWGIWGCCT